MTQETVQKKHWCINALISPFLEFHITGLDISDVSMKYVSFNREKKNKISIGAYGAIEYPEGIIRNGEVKDEEKLTGALARWFAKEKKRLPSPFVAISLPEEKSFIRVVQIPRVKREYVASAIRWEIENQIPLPFEEIMYDHEVIEPLREDQDHLDVIITAFPRSILNAYIRAIKGAGLEPYAVELESQSIVRACVPHLRDPEAKIIVDIGRARTSFIIFAGGAILYTSTIDMGGSLFEKSIAQQLGVKTEEAARITMDVGLDKTQQNGRIFAALAPMISTMSDELVRAISYYQTHAFHAHGATADIGRVIISGGGANLRGIDTYLTSVLKIPVDRADPFSILRHRIAYDIPPLTRREALSFAAVIGLALREIRQE